MSRQVMSPTLGRSTQDFPKLNGPNFAVWNARVRAALDGQVQLGFIDQVDYDGTSDSDLDSSESDTPTLPKSPDARVAHRRREAAADTDAPSDASSNPPSDDDAVAPQAPADDAVSSEPPSASSSEEEAKDDENTPARPTKKTPVSASTLPVISSLVSTKREA